MPLHRLSFTPGINAQLTQTANNAGWFACNRIRFRNGLLEKLGGWQRLFNSAVAGIARAIHAYEDLQNVNDLLIGTDAGPQLFANNTLTSLAVVRKTSFYGGAGQPTMTPSVGLTQVTVSDTNHGAATGNQIAIGVATSVGGQIIPANSIFTITVLDANTYTFNMQYAAVNSATGTIPHIALAATATTQQVTFASHGYAIGDLFPVDQTTSYIDQAVTGLISFTANAATFLTVANVIDTNTFTFTGGPYGDFPGSAGTYIGEVFSSDGVSAAPPSLPQWIYYYAGTPPSPTIWSIDNLGNNGLFVYTTSALFVFSPPLGSAYSGRTTVNRIRKVTAIGSSASMAASNGSTLITVTDTAFGGATNDTIAISMKTSVGGRIIPAGSTFTITKVDANSYTFNMAQAAASNASATLPVITVSPGTTQQVTFASHGLSIGNSFVTDQATRYFLDGVLGTITVSIPAGTALVVTNVIDANNFTFTGGPYCTGTASTNFNEGITYLGSGSPTYGPWIQYGAGAPTMQQTWLGLLPQIVNAGTSATVPGTNTGMLVAMPQAQVILWGTEPVIGSGTIDPLLLRFSDAGGFAVWTADATNQAGSFRLGGSGTKIVGGIQAPQTTLIFTDEDLWSMTYEGPPFVYGFTVIGSGCGLAAPLARAQLGRSVYWMSVRSFFSFGDGGFVPITCPVWDVIFNDLDTANQDKCFAGTSVSTQEIFFFYPSISGGTGECDKYVKVNVVSNLWDYGTLHRSAWLQENPFGLPLGADNVTRLIQQHEIGYDDDGAAMAGVYAETGYADMADGEQIMLLDEYIQDMKWFGADGAMQLTVSGVNYPGEDPTVKGPFGLDSTNRHVRPRLRKRQIALRFDWLPRKGFSARLGTARVRTKPAGRRP